jgi:hypothetical protein
MTAAKVLEALGRRGEATLSDGGDEPDAVDDERADPSFGVTRTKSRQSSARTPTSTFPDECALLAAPLRILEVGSGTGLVGMTAAKVLEALGRRGEATLQAASRRGG